MPVTAKLSRKFYETLGDDIANELVEWFNQVDATYRADLRELNELNFARFDAKLEQRMAELEARLERRIAELRAEFERRLAELDAKLERSIAELRAEIAQQMAQLKADLRVEIAESRAGLIRWMFVFWAGTLIPLAGLMVALAG
jgi:DNA anti-recombination protein RmuC